MKKYLLPILFIVLGAHFLCASESSVVSVGSLDAACEISSRKDCPVLLVALSRQCGACVKLQSEVLRSKWFNEGSSPLVVIEFFVEDNPQLARGLQLRATPAMFYLTGERKIISKIVGYESSAKARIWLDESRNLFAAGLWLGLSGSVLSDKSTEQLVDLLASADEVQRSSAKVQLKKIGKEIVNPLINALGSSVLASRVGAHELLLEMYAGLPVYDPWQAARDRENQLKEVRRWFTSDRRITTRIDPLRLRLAQEAFAGIYSDNPVERTRAMTEIVGGGEGVLPQLRKSIKLAASRNDTDVRLLLDDVRWYILCSNLRMDGKPVFYILSRGSTEQKIDAIKALAEEGVGSVKALAEIVQDGEELLVEAAMGVLSGVGGKEATAILGRILNSKGGGLRVVAAKKLGKGGGDGSVELLAAKVSDKDEEVACTAIAALGELEAVAVSDKLLSALSDKRWRVRAEAARVIGTLDSVQGLAELEKLLDDNDSFVASSAFKALIKKNRLPEKDRLLGAIKRIPALITPAVAGVLEVAHDQQLPQKADSLKLLESIFSDIEPGNKYAFLRGLSQHLYLFTGMNDCREIVLSLFHKITSVPDKKFQRELAMLFVELPDYLKIKHADVLWRNNPDIAAQISASLIPGQWRKALGYIGFMDRAGVLAGNISSAALTSCSGLHSATVTEGVCYILGGCALDFSEIKLARSYPQEFVTAIASTDSRRGGDAVASITFTDMLISGKVHYESLQTNNRKLLAHWKKNPTVANAIAVIASSPAPDYSLLEKSNNGEALNEKFSKSLAANLAILLARVDCTKAADSLSPLFNNKRYLPILCDALLDVDLQPQLYDRLFSSRTFISYFNGGASAGDASRLCKNIINTDGIYMHGSALREQLIQRRNDDNDFIRSLAVYVYYMSQDYDCDEIDVEELKKFLSDKSPWVRRAAIPGLTCSNMSLTQRYQLLLPLLDDPNYEVVSVAAYAMLGDKLRKKLYSRQVVSFIYADTVAQYYYRDYSEQPQGFIISKVEPEIIKKIISRISTLAEVNNQHARMARLFLCGVLLQHGDASGVSSLLLENAEKPAPEAMLLIAYGFSATGNDKYIKAVKMLLAQEKNIWDLHRTLEYTAGVKGGGARKLRRMTNRKIEGLE